MWSTGPWEADRTGRAEGGFHRKGCGCAAVYGEVLRQQLCLQYAVIVWLLMNLDHSLICHLSLSLSLFSLFFRGNKGRVGEVKVSQFPQTAALL